MGILIVILIFTFHTILFAEPSYELDVHYGFGTSELSFNSVPGIGISVYPIKNFGISTGLEYSWHWQTKTGSLSGSNPASVDDEGDSLIFKYTIDKYKEEWQGSILQIPILLKYSEDSYYAAAGIKIGIPQNTRTNISYKGLKTEGYYFKDSLHLTAPSFQGFGAQKDNSSKTKISNAKNLIMLALEGGVKFKLNDNFSLLTGAFADYSFNKGFSRTLPPAIERIQKKDSANLVANDTWKSWKPWSVGAMVKFSFSFEPHKKKPQIIDTIVTDPNITVKADTLPPPNQIEGNDPQSQRLIPPSPIPALNDSFQIPPLPEFLLNREPDFIFHYPETRTSPSDPFHIALVSQIADVLRTMLGSQLHCVGYSEKLISESVAYETAFQRSLRIRYTLSRFYGIEESRIFIYSQGSKNSGYRRAECFIISNANEFK
jgi:hypothetical protein